MTVCGCGVTRKEKDADRAPIERKRTTRVVRGQPIPFVDCGPTRWLGRGSDLPAGSRFVAVRCGAVWHGTAWRARALSLSGRVIVAARREPGVRCRRCRRRRLALPLSVVCRRVPSSAVECRVAYLSLEEVEDPTRREEEGARASSRVYVSND